MANAELQTEKSHHFAKLMVTSYELLRQYTTGITHVIRVFVLLWFCYSIFHPSAPLVTWLAHIIVSAVVTQPWRIPVNPLHAFDNITTAITVVKYPMYQIHQCTICHGTWTDRVALTLKHYTLHKYGNKLDPKTWDTHMIRCILCTINAREGPSPH